MSRSNYTSSGVVLWVIGLLSLGIIGVASVSNTNMEKVSTVTETRAIPYETTYVEDATVDYGKTVTRTTGASGLQTLTYKVVTKGGKEISRELVDKETTKKPQNAVVAKGTKPVWRCHDTTSYDRNPYNDNYCEYSDGTGKYVPDSEARRLDPDYVPGKAGAAYYNNF